MTNFFLGYLDHLFFLIRINLNQYLISFVNIFIEIVKRLLIKY